MDVVLTPIGSQGNAWSLKDRLGRNLGSVKRESGFEIEPEPTSKLEGISHRHLTLDAVMTAIEAHMQGACSLDSQHWD
ncbi:hypothetical protein HCU64_22570 [Methylobacterium sp. C25]|uniref:hypothetical protein n=1 Tax=Methylobacterium sp. C25 TaxID=2721622 RepID=UPI001F416805|nr:hypothetical protein [Methylobacterium sp. C25]MCE4226531.1 hypothetical protein [Methylobacterium sp. C25]